MANRPARRPTKSREQIIEDTSDFFSRSYFDKFRNLVDAEFPQGRITTLGFVCAGRPLEEWEGIRERVREIPQDLFGIYFVRIQAYKRELENAKNDFDADPLSSNVDRAVTLVPLVLQNGIQRRSFADEHNNRGLTFRGWSSVQPEECAGVFLDISDGYRFVKSMMPEASGAQIWAIMQDESWRTYIALAEMPRIIDATKGLSLKMTRGIIVRAIDISTNELATDADMDKLIEIAHKLSSAKRAKSHSSEEKIIRSFLASMERTEEPVHEVLDELEADSEPINFMSSFSEETNINWRVQIILRKLEKASGYQGTRPEMGTKPLNIFAATARRILFGYESMQDDADVAKLVQAAGRDAIIVAAYIGLMGIPETPISTKRMRAIVHCVGWPGGAEDAGLLKYVDLLNDDELIPFRLMLREVRKSQRDFFAAQMLSHKPEWRMTFYQYADAQRVEDVANTTDRLVRILNKCDSKTIDELRSDLPKLSARKPQYQVGEINTFWGEAQRLLGEKILSKYPSQSTLGGGKPAFYFHF